jgi:hypothetical protein
MKHLPFEDWLFSDDPMDGDQERELHEHLEICNSCWAISRAWGEVEDILERVPVVEPAAGFGDRFEARLAVELSMEKIRRQNRQSLGLFALTAGTASSIFTILVWQVINTVDSFTSLLLVGIDQVVITVAMINAMHNMLSALTYVVIPSVPPVYWAALAAMISLSTLAWLLLLGHLFNSRRITIL